MAYLVLEVQGSMDMFDSKLYSFRPELWDKI